MKWGSSRGKSRATTKSLMPAVLAIALSAPTIALGLRVKLHEVAAPPAVRAAILKAWAHGTVLSRGHKACLNVWLAASNHDYGTVRFRLTKTCERRYAFNGIEIFKRGNDDHWRYVGGGGAYHCPLPRIPRRVQRDLGVCP
jgi:hypothetical protein